MMSTDPADADKELTDNDLVSSAISSFDAFLKSYCDLWAKYATNDNIERAKSLRTVHDVVDSNRELETLKSMDDIVNCLTRRNVGSTQLLRMLQDVAISTDDDIKTKTKEKPQWLRNARILISRQSSKMNQSMDKEAACPCVVDHKKQGDLENQFTKVLPVPYDDVKFIPLRFDDLNSLFLTKVFLKLVANKPLKWRRVLQELVGMTERELQVEREKYCHDMVQEFVRSVQTWKIKHPQEATWENFHKAISKVDNEVAGYMIDQKS